MSFTATYSQQKPMSISSITSPLNEMSSPLSPSSTSSTYHPHSNNSYKPHHLISFVHYSNTIDPVQDSVAVDPSTTGSKHTQQVPAPLPPPTFSYSSSESSSLSSSYTTSGIERSPSPSSSSLHHHHVYKSNQSGDENGYSNDNSTLSPASHFSSVSVSGPLSLEERRQRNKTASAKYRAKKNQQQQGMRAMIHSMTKENDLLLRQLDQAKAENRQLKTACDKLRSKMMAEKMFKKMLYHQQQQQQQPSSDENQYHYAYFQTPPVDSADTDSSSNLNDSSEDNDKKVNSSENVNMDA